MLLVSTKKRRHETAEESETLCIVFFFNLQFASFKIGANTLTLFDHDCVHSVLTLCTVNFTCEVSIFTTVSLRKSS